MINWLLKKFTRKRLEITHTIAVIHSIRLYTHIKNIPFQSFMKWAFGDSWESIKLNKFHIVWNERHSQLSMIKEAKDLSSIMYAMVDWYIQINKSQ